MTLRTIITSLFVHLGDITSIEMSPLQRPLVKKQGLLLYGFMGKLSTDKDDMWDAVNAVIFGRDWSIGHARVFVCWIAGSEHHRTEVDGKLECLPVTRIWVP